MEGKYKRGSFQDLEQRQPRCLFHQVQKSNTRPHLNKRHQPVSRSFRQCFLHPVWIPCLLYSLHPTADSSNQSLFHGSFSRQLSFKNSAVDQERGLQENKFKRAGTFSYHLFNGAILSTV